MHKYIQISLILFLTTNVNARGQTNVFNGNGANSCLIGSPGSCPITFLKKAICYRDADVCTYHATSEQYYFNNNFFVNKFKDLVFEGMSDNQARAFLMQPDNAAQHEIFEFTICSISPESCYPSGSSGLTIYDEDPSSDDCDPAVFDCHGGPPDSAVCQVTPEACSGSVH